MTVRKNSQLHALSLISIVCLSTLCACAPHSEKHIQTSTSLNSFLQLSDTSLLILQDSSLTMRQLQEAFIPVFESLWDESGDVDDLDKRLIAQKKSLCYHASLSKWFEAQMEKGVSVSAEEINRLLLPLTAIGSQWFCDPDDDYPYIWREIYYRSNQQSENPVDSYFKVMVILPNDKSPLPSLHIFFPHTAVDSPRLVFSNDSDGITGTYDYFPQEVIDFDDEHWKVSHDDIPLTAFGGNDLVEKMLKYDVMFFSFRSAPNEPGNPPEDEIALLPLAPFKISYNTVINSNQ